MNKKIVLTFYDENGEVVKQLSKDPASGNDIMAALQFLNTGCEINIACREVEPSSPGNN